jgi:hypothetical protein
MTNAGGFFSNAGTFSNTSNAVFQSNVSLTNAGGYLSNSGNLVMTKTTGFFSNAGHLSNIGNLVMPTAAGFFSNTGYFSNVNNATFLQQVGISNAPATGFALDVNGPSRAAVSYSNIIFGTTSGFTNSSGTFTPTTANYGTYYNLSGGASGTGFTFTLSLTDPNLGATSNIGKYMTFRNNTTNGDLSFSVTFGGTPLYSGITNTTLYSNTSITVLLTSNITPNPQFTYF